MSSPEAHEQHSVVRVGPLAPTGAREGLLAHVASRCLAGQGHRAGGIELAASQRQHETGAASGVALDHEIATHAAREITADGQSEAESLA